MRLLHMASSEESKNVQQSGSAWEALGRLERQTAVGLWVLAGLLSLIPIIVGIKYHMEYFLVCLWGGALALVALLAGLWRFFVCPSRLSAADAARLLILIVGGLSGFLTVVF